MNLKYIHVVSFNIPYPPNYGGIIDVYYKLKSLHHLGVKIILHCFDYGRGEQPELNELCAEVNYYKRDTGVLKSISKIPYIINSRSNTVLLNNLQKDDYPILFEGLHSTYFLDNFLLKDRFKIVRVHNVEHDYYKFLSKQEQNIFKYIYFSVASKKLKKYESVLKYADAIATISPKDLEYFSKKYNNSFWLPPFHSNREVSILQGAGSYLFYHGNLSVVENIKSVLFLIDIYKDTDIKLVIAGKNPVKQLKQIAKRYDNIDLVSNPTEKEMNKMISEAHINLLPTFQSTGIKLKLIESLYKGRFCIANDDMIKGTGLEKLCYVANSKEEFINVTNKLMNKSFSIEDVENRKNKLSTHLSNEKNAEYLIQQIWG
jgi:hypothetical protein